MSSSNSRKQDHVVLCLSGGMDSTALLLHYLSRGFLVHGLSFDYGQKHRIELERLQSNLTYFRQQGITQIHWKLIDLTSTTQLLPSALTCQDVAVPLGHYEDASMKSTFVPNRNAIFCSIAYGFALSLAQEHHAPVKLGLGVHSGDHAIYPDCRPEFYSALLNAFKIGNWNSERVDLELPYLHWSKSDILIEARESVDALQLDFATVFRNTCTSYLPDAHGRSLGQTGSDVERILAFHRLGWTDPIEYQVPWPQAVQRAMELERDVTARLSGESAAADQPPDSERKLKVES